MDPIGFLIIGAAAVIGGVISYFVAKTGTRTVLGVLWGLFIVFSAYMVMLTMTTPGWEALTYLIVLLFGCAPAGVGMIIGSLLGRSHRVKATIR